MLNTMGLDDNTTELGQKEEGDGEHRAGDGEVGIKNTMEEGHRDGKPNTESSYGEEESRQYAFSSSSTSSLPETHMHHQFFHESMSAYGTLGKHENMATYATSGEHAHGNMAAYDTLGDHAQENMAAQGTSGEYAHKNMIAYGTSREHTLENMAASCTADENVLAYGTLGGHALDNMAAYATSVDHSHENMAAYGTLDEHVHENISANSDFGLDSMMTKGQLGGYAHETMSVNGNLGGFAQKSTSANGETGGYAYEYMSANGDLGGKVHDYMTAHGGESGGNAHENMLKNVESGGEDVNIILNFAVNSTNIPSLMNSATKTGCLLSASSYYNSQSRSIKKLELMLRFGSAMFSLIAFSVMVSTNEKRIAAGSTFYVKFSDFQAYNYLVALNLLSFLYSSGQLIMFAQSKSSSILSSPIKWGALVYICDQMLAFLLVSSSSSAATASELSQHGLHNIWPPACSTWKLWLFCSKADGAVVMSFFSSLFVLLTSFSSGYHLSQLLAE